MTAYVKHSRTSSVSSYAKDFKDLIGKYTVPKMTSRKAHKNISYEQKDDSENYSSGYDMSAEEESSLLDSEEDEDVNICDNYKVNLTEDSSSLKENQLTVEYLEDELDIPHVVDDLDGTHFHLQYLSCGPSNLHQLVLAKTHLRHVHDEFHQGSLQVVVATIAFGMGIDKSNVRRIIHYGWPQVLHFG
ncbi:hypothetical protein GW17_00029052 [Ensete ventricosum]|nr:hypothetical protein GW17_00029052 [Ensete ventricosum]